MMEAAEKLDYERAADLRDQIKKLERHAFGMDQPRHPVQPSSRPARPINAPASKKASRQKPEAAAAPAPLREPPQGASRPVKQGRLKLIPDNPK